MKLKNLVFLILLSGCTTLLKAPLPPQTTAHLEPTLLEGRSKNPFITHMYTADPTARVFKDRVYLYASHDLDDQTGYDMVDYHVYSSDDLVNWMDHGMALHAKDISWASRLYAPDCIYNERDGKYYLYFPNGGSNIGVAVSDNPEGPFVDALGKPLITGRYPNSNVPWVFDPAVFIDQDNQGYLYFGGGMPNTGDNARVIRLGEDLISLKDDEATTIIAPDFFEAAFMNKFEDKYYFSYSTNWENGHGIRIDYLMSDNPMTDFVYTGTVINNPPGNQGNNNHHSIVEYKGQKYVFYHDRKLALERGITGGYQRSISFDKLELDPQGKIITVAMTQGSTNQLKNVDPFNTIEAELLAAQYGVKVGNIISEGTKAGASLTDLDYGDWTAVSQVDFGNGAESFSAKVASIHKGGSIEIWIDGGEDNGGTLLGTCEVPNTRTLNNWEEVSTPIQRVTGVHNLYLIYKGETVFEDMFLLDSYSFQ